MPERIHVEVRGGTGPKRSSGIGFLLLLPGLFFIGFGVLVLFVPDLLRIMVAAAFMMVGVGLCLGARRMRRMKQQFSMFDQQFRPPQ